MLYSCTHTATVGVKGLTTTSTSSGLLQDRQLKCHACDNAHML